LSGGRAGGAAARWNVLGAGQNGERKATRGAEPGRVFIFLYLATSLCDVRAPPPLVFRQGLTCSPNAILSPFLRLALPKGRGRLEAHGGGAFALPLQVPVSVHSPAFMSKASL